MKQVTRIAVLVAIAALAAMPARASSGVDVTLRLSTGEPLASAQVKACAVHVPLDADGVDVLQAAKDAECISSYATTTYPGVGTFVDCIDGICGTAATYWRMTENGVMTSYGADGFRAAQGDLLGFSYTQWATCLTDVGC